MRKRVWRVLAPFDAVSAIIGGFLLFAAAVLAIKAVMSGLTGFWFAASSCAAVGVFFWRLDFSCHTPSDHV